MSRCFIHAFVFIVFCYPYLNVLSSISYQCHVLSVEFSCLYAFYTWDYYEMCVSLFPCLCMLFLYDFIYRFVFVSCFTCLLTGKGPFINYVRRTRGVGQACAYNETFLVINRQKTAYVGGSGGRQTLCMAYVIYGRSLRI